MLHGAEPNRPQPESADPHEEESHELPRGALLITLGFLLLLTLMWLQVYLQLLTSGGVPR